MGAESGMNSSVRDDRVALSDGAKALWGKTNRIDDSEWLPLYVHMVDSAAMASKNMGYVGSAGHESGNSWRPWKR